MELDNKNYFSKGERVVIAGAVTLGNIIYGFQDKNKNKTVAQLLQIAGIATDKVSEDVKRILEHKVSQVCRAGSRFTKDCICVQLYDDGPGVLKWAMEHGALLCIARYAVEGYPCIVTEHPEAFYAAMCGALRRQNVSTVAITGSIGKTTAKKMIASMYQAQMRTFCDAGNDNQLDGVGYISQHIPSKTEVWVQEVSEDTPGSITHISCVVKPNIAVITAIDKSHIEEFGDEQGIHNEIHSIIDHMPSDGICVTSMDEENTRNLVNERRVMYVSLHNTEADFYAREIAVKQDGLYFSIVEKNSQRQHPMKLDYVFAEHNIYAALYAFACGVISGVSYENIRKGIEQYRASGVRQNIYADNGVTIYADCYNAVAKSVRSAVHAAEKIPVSGRRIAVIGDIAETGSFTEATHRELVEIVNESNFDVLLAYGSNTCFAAEQYKNRDDLEVICCTDRNMLNQEIKRHAKRGDLILFKASHSTGLEKSLMKCFPKSYWMKMFAYYWPQLTWRFVVLFN